MKFILLSTLRVCHPWLSSDWEPIIQNDVLFMGFTITGLNTVIIITTQNVMQGARLFTKVAWTVNHLVLFLHSLLPAGVPAPMFSLPLNEASFSCLQDPMVSRCWAGGFQLSPKFKMLGAGWCDCYSTNKNAPVLVL